MSCEERAANRLYAIPGAANFQSCTKRGGRKMSFLIPSFSLMRASKTTSIGRGAGWVCWRAMGILGLAVSCLLIVGCIWVRNKAPVSPTTKQGKRMLQESDIRAIARKAVTAHDTWAESAIYEVRREGSGWSVIVRRIEGYDQSGRPQFVPGGHRIVQIDDAGRVTAYIRGK